MKTKKIMPWLISVALTIFIIYSCSKSDTSPGQPAPGGGGTGAVTVEISGFKFPATTTVKKGATVTWHNGDAAAHTVTSNDGTTFNSGSLAANGSFSFKANTAGTFAYHCNFHSGMTGSLVVSP